MLIYSLLLLAVKLLGSISDIGWWAERLRPGALLKDMFTLNLEKKVAHVSLFPPTFHTYHSHPNQLGYTRKLPGVNMCNSLTTAAKQDNQEKRTYVHSQSSLDNYR